jgi:hypothetical protein
MSGIYVPKTLHTPQHHSLIRDCALHYNNTTLHYNNTTLHCNNTTTTTNLWTILGQPVMFLQKADELDRRAVIRQHFRQLIFGLKVSGGI